MTLLSFGPEEARVAADLRQRLESQGQTIGMADYMIAAVCIATNSILLTRNRKHLERVKDLKLSGCAMSER
jgi:predicted nucleic acid-binding protein